MKNLIRLEEIALMGLSIYLFSLADIAWWWYLVLLLAPDIGMLGYALGSKIGAITYNFTHHRAVAIIVLLIGFMVNIPWLIAFGAILLGHASLDRILGYGLKYFSSFNDTHLGIIGKKKTTEQNSKH